jgi:hypothetical protein
MKRYPCPTKHGGTTIILDSLMAAIQIGHEFLYDETGRFKESQHGQKLDVRAIQRDGKAMVRKMTAGQLLEQYEASSSRYGECVQAIVKGDDGLRQEIDDLIGPLRDMVLDIEPRLNVGHLGFERAEEGIDTSPDLCASGEASCCLRRRRASDMPADGVGDGAYRIIINTDVSWWGKPSDNAALMGALVLVFQTFRPVEIWIQQGWLGDELNNGVTLFKLDFEGSFEPTQLAFWLGHPWKDHEFSFWISRALGRTEGGTSTIAEIPCDLYLRGDWMSQYDFQYATPQRQREIMAKWIADTCMKIAFPDRLEAAV